MHAEYLLSDDRSSCKNQDHVVHRDSCKGKGKGRYSSSWEHHLRATGRHLPCEITQCYLPPDTSECSPPNPSHAGWYSIYLPRRDGRLSLPSWLDSAPVGSRTSDLSITSATPNHGITKTIMCRRLRHNKTQTSFFCNKNTFCGTRYLSDCCSLHGTVLLSRR